jgi:pimeloyl-ACP methyl ester carboxylesterase
VRTVEGVRQAVIELRLLLEWLSERGCPFFAAWGTSYGAWIVALLACVEPRLDRAVLIEPIVDIQASIWESPACAAIRFALRRRGVVPEQTAPHLRLCCPLHAPLPLPLDPSHVLLLAGHYDRVAPPAVVRALHQRWEGSHFHEFPQGHVGYRLLPESFRLAGELWPDRFFPWNG